MTLTLVLIGFGVLFLRSSNGANDNFKGVATLCGGHSFASPAVPRAVSFHGGVKRIAFPDVLVLPRLAPPTTQSFHAFGRHTSGGAMKRFGREKIGPKRRAG
ncbi:MAG TPA: hypothetical protein VKA46_28410 [Gemmataceae bacterium]|nr:hypothetical protein [Gemmataceae bacterium]